MSTPCAVKWCGALATRGRFCPVHYDHPLYDNRSHEEILSTRSALPAKGPTTPRPKKTPVDSRPLIVQTEYE
jgi:hypothetical protein